MCKHEITFNWFFESQLDIFSVILSPPCGDDVKMIRKFIFIFFVYFTVILANDLNTLSSQCFNDSLETSNLVDQIENCDTENYAEIKFVRKKKFYCISYRSEAKNQFDPLDHLEFTTNSVFDLFIVSFSAV